MPRRQRYLRDDLVRGERRDVPQRALLTDLKRVEYDFSFSPLR